jgi:flagellar biosynthesis anti-sigma factor FlgM
MVDSINDLGRAVLKPELESRQVKRTDDSESIFGLSEAASKALESGTDEVVLSPDISETLERAAFDQTKVDQIKQAISEGSYPLDSRRIAESFASIERLISN